MERYKTRVLIVDDHPPFRRQFRRLLEFAGLEVVGEAGDIPAAEALMRDLKPDLAVVDLLMPGVNGLEGIARLKALLPAMKVYLISAYGEHPKMFQMAARNRGAEDFFKKDDLDVSLVEAWNVKPKQ